MLKREIDDKLLNWKNSKYRKPLLLFGARQVGKSYSLKKFQKNYFYEKSIYIDLMIEQELKSRLNDIKNPKIIIDIINNYYKIKITDDWLIIFDEIQELPSLRTSLKFFCEQEYQKLFIIASGSYLSNYLYNDNEGFPVGKVDILHMYPLTFKEYIYNLKNKESIISNIQNNQLNSSLHQTIINDILFEYIYLGGMPEVINNWFESNDLLLISQIKNALYQGYLRDISKKVISKVNSNKTIFIFENIINFLAKENKTFSLSLIDKNARYRDYEDALLYLLRTNIIYKLECLKSLSFPLNNHKEISRFKLYYFDLGIISYLLNLDKHTLFNSNDKNIQTYKGSLIENFINNEIISKFYLTNQFFYKFIHNGVSYEIDFILNDQDNKIIPIEVKSSNNFKLKSLLTFIKLNPDIKNAIVFSTRELSYEVYLNCKIYYLPLYLISWLEFNNNKLNIDSIKKWFDKDN